MSPRGPLGSVYLKVWSAHYSLRNADRNESLLQFRTFCKCHCCQPQLFDFLLPTSENTKQAGCHHKLHAGENIFRCPQVFSTCDQSGWIKWFFSTSCGGLWVGVGLCSDSFRLYRLWCSQSWFVRVCVCGGVVFIIRCCYDLSEHCESINTQLTEGSWRAIKKEVHRELKKTFYFNSFYWWFHQTQKLLLDLDEQSITAATCHVKPPFKHAFFKNIFFFPRASNEKMDVCLSGLRWFWKVFTFLDPKVHKISL